MLLTKKAHLETVYGENIMAMRFATTKELTSLRLCERTPVHEHGFKMITLLKKLRDLDAVLPSEFSVNLILLSLPNLYEAFIVNFQREYV